MLLAAGLEASAQTEPANFTGTRRTYYANGKVQSSIEYRNGRIYGRYVTYNEQGYVTEEGTYHYNKWVGKYYLYYADGGLQQNFTFDENGNRNGLQRYYYQNGRLQMLSKLTRNAQDGYFLEFDSLGHLAETPAYYINGRRTDYSNLEELYSMLEIARMENEVLFLKPE